MPAAHPTLHYQCCEGVACSMPLCAALAAGCVLELLARVHSHKYVCSRLRTPNLLAGMCRGGTCMLAGVCACVIGPRALRGRRSRLTALLQMVQHRRAGECNVLVGHAGRRLQYACRHACMWWVQYACYHAGWRLQYAEWSCLLWWVLHYAGAEPQTAWPVLVRGCVRCGRLAACYQGRCHNMLCWPAPWPARVLC